MPNDNELLARSDLLLGLKRFFDVWQAGMDSFPFIADLKTGTYMVAQRLVEEFDLPGIYLTELDEAIRPLVYFEDAEAYDAAFQAVLHDKTSDTLNLEFRASNRRGEYTWLWIKGNMGYDDKGEREFFTGFIMHMDRVLHGDPVTGLLNRYAFDEALAETVQKAAENGGSGAVMVIGLDDFHILQESADHDVADAALREIGQNISNVLPTHLNLYKLSETEFGIVWPDALPEEIAIIFSSIQLCLREVKAMNESVFFSVSAGVAFYPDSGTIPNTLGKYAQSALKMARQRGREQLNFFAPEEYKKWQQFMSMQRSFEESIERGCEGFLLYFQPQVDADTQEVIGAEALLRWREPDGEIISPMVFIPVLERTRLIIPVGRWVVFEAARMCQEWQKIKPGFTMSVNVSLCQLENHDFHSDVQEALEATGLAPEHLTLELTESQSVANWDFINEQFDRFRDMGVKVAMDDFGVGYSSLALLKNFNCDIIKVDKVFVDDIMTSAFDRQLVKYTVQLCQSVGMAVCIEGVEEKEVYDYLHDECHPDVIQGFYFGRPEPPDLFVEKFFNE